ncbi:MAG TPA: hypothetical protein VKA60_23530 [Blastocatellia bacterium]|nr:hypothetical protein [Blastocatellia bacterium]
MFGYDGSDNSPLTSPLLRALAIAGQLGVLPWQREERAYQQKTRERQDELYQQAQQDRARQRQAEDFDTRLKLQSAGAVPQTDTLKRFTSILGSPSSHTLMDTPVGKEFIPTQQTTDERALRQYASKKRADVMAEMQSFTVPDELGGGTYPIKIGTAVENLVRVHGAVNPNLHFEAKSSRDGTWVLGFDPRTGEEKSRRHYPDIMTDQPLHFFVNNDGVVTGLDSTGKPVSATGPGIGKTKKAENDDVTRSEFLKFKTAQADFERERSAAVELIKAAEAEKDPVMGQPDPGLLDKAQEQIRKATALMHALEASYPNFIVKSGLGSDHYNLPYVEGLQNLSGAARAEPMPSPAISESQSKAQTALQNYRKMPPEKRNAVDPNVGISPRQWYTRAFGVDPETLSGRKGSNH